MVFGEQAALLDMSGRRCPPATDDHAVLGYAAVAHRIAAPGEAVTLADPRRAIVALSDVGIGYRFAPQLPPSINGWTAFGRAAVRPVAAS